MPRIRANGVTLHVAEHGPSDGEPVLLLHGFPELGYSWRHQWPALAEAGYRVLVPDMRGYGRSDVPEAVEAYAMDELVGDVCALIDHAGAEQAVVVGHDWGAFVAWSTAWLAPDRVRAVAGLSVPFVPRAPAAPIPIMRRHLGEDFYIVWFQEPGVAEEVLERDARRTLRSQKIWDPSWDAAEAADPRRPKFWTEEDEREYVEAFQRTGFSGGLSYYRNMDRNWERSAHAAERRVEQPAFFLTGERDPVRQFMPAEAMDGWVTDLRAAIVVPRTGHWVNQEAPEPVNAALLDWLSSL